MEGIIEHCPNPRVPRDVTLFQFVSSLWFQIHLSWVQSLSLFKCVTYLCRVVKFAEQIVECLDQFLHRQRGGERGEAAYVSEQNGDVVVPFNKQLAERMLWGEFLKMKRKKDFPFTNSLESPRRRVNNFGLLQPVPNSVPHLSCYLFGNNAEKQVFLCQREYMKIDSNACLIRLKN